MQYSKLTRLSSNLQMTSLAQVTVCMHVECEYVSKVELVLMSTC